MPVPILRQADLLVATIQASLSDQDLVRFRDDLAREIGRARSTGVVIDVTALDVLDSFASRVLRTIAHTARLRGATTVVVGIQPGVALAMVQLGVSLEGIPTALDFEDGIALLRGRRRKKAHEEGAHGG